MQLISPVSPLRTPGLAAAAQSVSEMQFSGAAHFYFPTGYCFPHRILEGFLGWHFCQGYRKLVPASDCVREERYSPLWLPQHRSQTKYISLNFWKNVCPIKYKVIPFPWKTIQNVPKSRSVRSLIYHRYPVHVKKLSNSKKQMKNVYNQELHTRQLSALPPVTCTRYSWWVTSYDKWEPDFQST